MCRGRLVSSTNAILTGLGLVIVLAIGGQLLAERFHIPAIVLLLPVGFTAGAITEDVHPDVIFGNAFQPIVSLGVGLILFEAGLRLSLRELRGGVRGIVLRLISIGTILTLVCVTAAAKLIFGFGWGVSAVIGAILVVSGPTVVSPLLAFVRPTDTVRSVLKWEGTLIDPIGALLGVVALHAVLQGIAGSRPFHLGELASSLLIGLGIGLAAAAALMVLLGGLERSSPGRGVAAALMMLSAAVVGADLIRDDSGLVAAAVMGMVLAHQRRIDVARILRFHGTIVELLIGVLFVLISASVTPAEVGRVLLGGLILVAAMVILVRPLVVALGTWRSPLRWRERAFVAWMAPRGIVAAATASAFSLYLAEADVHDAERILPIVFVAVFSTVVLYGLTAPPLARILGLAGAGSPVVLIVGANPLALAIARVLANAGVRVRLWTDSPEEQAAARDAGLQAAPVPLGVDVEGLQAELEEVSSALVITASDQFNALAAYELRQELGHHHVYRLAPSEPPAIPLPPHAEGRVLFSNALSFPELSRRIAAGAELIERTAAELAAAADGLTPLFVLPSSGELHVLTAAGPADAPADSRVICLRSSSASASS